MHILSANLLLHDVLKAEKKSKSIEPKPNIIEHIKNE